MEIINNDVELEHLGSGVCIFRNAFSANWEAIFQTATELVDLEHADMYQQTIHPETGEMAYINKSGYLFTGESMDAMPRRGSVIHRDSRPQIAKMLQDIGPDQGFDSLGDLNMADNMSKFFGRLSQFDGLTHTIVYNLNPRDSEMFASMAANFNDGKVAGKMQYGAAWWFLDQKDGMEKQMNALSNMGLISTFIGMITDSRSFLSYSRHEYFRRILCNMLGEEMEKGLLPTDENWIGKIVQQICYYNAKEYFNL